MQSRQGPGVTLTICVAIYGVRLNTLKRYRHKNSIYDADIVRRCRLNFESGDGRGSPRPFLSDVGGWDASARPQATRGKCTIPIRCQDEASDVAPEPT